MIESVTYCQICGSKLEKHISETIHHPYCHTCKKISYLDPKVATVIIIENNSTILLVKRDIEPNIGRWSFPSGYVDRGEKTEIAAAREVKEETGIEIKVIGLQGVYSGKGAVIVIVYKAIALNPKSGNPREEVQEIKWFPIKDLPDLPFPYDDEIIFDYLNS